MDITCSPVLLCGVGCGYEEVEHGLGTTNNLVINGNSFLEAAVRLTNKDHGRITNLSVTSPTSDLTPRKDIHVMSSDGKTQAGIPVDGNTVYNVAGQTNKATHSSDFILSRGIFVDVNGTDSRYDDVLVLYNKISHCGGGGIKVRVGSIANQGLNTHITKNDIDAYGGDTILVSYGESPLIDYNVASNLGTGKYSWTRGNFASMWVLGDHNPSPRRLR